MINRLHFELAFNIASSNWLLWQDVWAYKGQQVKDSPIFQRERFLKFSSEYSVLRYVKTDTRYDICRYIRDNYGPHRLIESVDGLGVEELTSNIFDKFGGDRHHSFSSKIAAFLNPTVFLASDRFSRAGARKYLIDRMGYNHNAEHYGNYVNYLNACNEIWNREQAGFAARLATLEGWQQIDTTNLAFQRRMLDVLLMMNGGRWLTTPALKEPIFT